MSKILFKVYFFILLYIGSAQYLYSQPNFYYYKTLGIKEGLSQSKVRCVLNDHKGYLWVGTEFGLNRYDRDHFKQYFHRPEDDKTLLSNRINFIAEDSLHNLWVATINPIGICLYNRDNDNFETLLDNGKPIFVTSYLMVEGGILFAGSGRIYKYVYATRQLKVLYDTCNDSLSFYFLVWEMIRYDDESVLLNTQRNGIYSFNLKTNRVQKVESFSEKHYSSIFLDSYKRLWVGVYGDGLYCYQNGALLKHFTMNNSPLTYNVIHDIAEKDNSLWVATDGGGINVISLDNYSFTNICQINDDIYSFPTNSIYHLYLDAGNNMWAGSIRGGLIGIKSVYARSFRNMPWGNMYGLSNQSINRIFQDHNGMIWIGTDGGGLNRFEQETGTFKHYIITKHEKIVSIAEYSSNELLFYSFNKGLFIFNKQAKKIYPFVLVNKEINDNSCINGYSVYISNIDENNILFSTTQNVIIYDITTKKFAMVATKGKEYERNSPQIIKTIGTKTYLLDLKGICEYDAATTVFKTIYRGECVLNDACVDQNGVFWLASVEGVLQYNPRSGECNRIRTNLFQEATSIISDRQDRLWVGTRHHLYVYSPQKQSFISLDEGDGVLPNEYIPHATLLAENGDILIGGVTGMTCVNSAVHFDADTVQKIELLDVLLDGLSVSLSEDSREAINIVKIPWDFSSLQLKVLLNEKDVFRKNLFRFDVKELNQELKRSGSNTLVINYLPIGEYTITASYYTRDGAWSPKQKIIHIVVTPPWWKTSWFYVGVCLILALLVYCIVYYLLRKKKIKQKREIVQLKNKMYEEKISFLTNISHELRTPLTLICAPLKRIIDHKPDNKEMDKLLLPIYKQAYQMKNIIDMVLDVRKLEEGKEILHILPYSLNEWVCSVGEKFVHEFEVKRIKLQYQLDERIKEVPFDKNKCEFVLSNFLMNALKFSEPDTVTIISSQLSEDDWARVSVKDEGMGLSMVDTESLFSNFYQGAHEKGGTGIGLSYAKSLITLHKGKIGALNNCDKGAVFYYELPISGIINESSELMSSKKTIEDVGQEVASIDYAYLEKFSIVIIEDTADLRNFLKEALGHYFARVYVAKDGRDGVEQIKLHLPDIIISDVMMPRMNGFELCRQVKTDLEISHIPFILLTAYHNSQNMYIGYKTGADAFLPKPFEVDGLLALCYNQLKLREQIRSRYKEDNLLTYKEVSFSNADETFLLKLDALISDNMSNPELDVTFLATNMYISRSLLFNKVKTITGMGIVDYVNKQRIDKSIVLMNTTSMNITEISEVVGFSSLRYFSKVFKSIIGETPSNYRKQDQ